MTVTYPFPTDPPGINAAGEGTLLWVPAIEDINAPTAEEINAGINLSCVVYGFSVDATQNRVERVKYCSKTVTEQLGQARWTIDDIEYDYDPQSPDDGDYGHYGELTPGLLGFLVDRRGLEPTEAVESGQFVNVFAAELGVQIPLAIDARNEGEKHRVRQPVAVRGSAINVAVAA